MEINTAVGAVPTAANLTLRTINALKTSFDAYGHNPSPDQWDAIKDIAVVLSNMAVGLCPLKAHLSSLDTGVGKTSVVIAFLKVLMRNAAYRDVGVMICMGRLDQISDIVREAGLNAEDYACLTSDPKFDDLGIGKTNCHKARVLFTTHQQIELRISFRGSFEDIGVFHYRDKARAVRVWDKAYMPALPITVYRTAIARLFDPLRRIFPELERRLEELHSELKGLPAGEVFQLPDLEEYESIDTIRAILKDKREGENTVAAAEHLWMLSNRQVTIRRDSDIEAGGRDTIALDYREHMPSDLFPLLILDASGRVRTLYKLWERRRGSLVKLKYGKKSYKAHTVYRMRVPGSKTAWRDQTKSKLYAENIAKVILSRQDEPFLVVHHKPNSAINYYDIEKALRGLLPTSDFERVHFTTWGKHDASNEWRDIPNVIIAGLLHLPKSMVEASGRAASALPSSEGVFSSEDVHEVYVGELKHKAIQAIGRGSVRGCINGACPESRTWIMALPRDGFTPENIKKLLPDCTVKEWRPVDDESSSRRLKIKRLRLDEALEVIKKHQEIALTDVMKAMGYDLNRDSRKNFNEAVRQRDEFQDALNEAGYREIRKGRQIFYSLNNKYI